MHTDRVAQLKDAVDKMVSRSTRNSSGCLIYGGAITSTGYGNMMVGGKVMLCTRIVATLNSGRELTKDDVVMHSCDVKSCVNALHLSVGTHSENSLDMRAKGREYRGYNPRCSTCFVNSVSSLKSTICNTCRSVKNGNMCSCGCPVYRDKLCQSCYRSKHRIKINSNKRLKRAAQRAAGIKPT
jgi:hypothetical protein